MQHRHHRERMKDEENIKKAERKVLRTKIKPNKLNEEESRRTNIEIKRK